VHGIHNQRSDENRTSDLIYIQIVLITYSDKKLLGPQAAFNILSFPDTDAQKNQNKKLKNKWER